MNNIDRKVVGKWKPIIEGNFYIRNRNLIEHICNYCEWFSINDTSYGENKLPEKLVEIKNNLSNSKRVTIIKKVFNLYTGVEEYELSNGRYVPVKSEFNYELSTDELVEVLGLEYMKFYDPIEFRDKQIDKIIL